jgi:hypothetical protein
MPGNTVYTPHPIPTVTPFVPQSVAGKINIQSPVVLDSSTIEGMNAAFTQLFSEAKSRGYTKYVGHSDYTVIVRNDCQLINGTMAWKEYVPDYGEIWQAEQVRISSNKVQTFQICKDVSQNMSNTTRYGAEHIILYFNNRPEFERTKIHTDAPETWHPIIR